MTQLVMCIREVRLSDLSMINMLPGLNGVLAHKSKVYTMLDSETCHCGERVISVAEIQHKINNPCFSLPSALPSKHFVPLNDPKFKEEPESYNTPVPKKVMDEVEKNTTLPVGWHDENGKFTVGWAKDYLSFLRQRRRQ